MQDIKKMGGLMVYVTYLGSGLIIIFRMGEICFGPRYRRIVTGIQNTIYRLIIKNRRYRTGKSYNLNRQTYWKEIILFFNYLLVCKLNLESLRNLVV